MNTTTSIDGIVDHSWRNRLAVMDAECARVGIEPIELRRHILQRISGVLLQTGGPETLMALMPGGISDRPGDSLEDQIKRGDQNNRDLLVDGYLLPLIEDIVERYVIQALIARVHMKKHDFKQLAGPLCEIAQAVIADDEYPIPPLEAAMLVIGPLLGYSHGGSLTLPDRTYRFADGTEIRNLEFIGDPDPRQRTSENDG